MTNQQTNQQTAAELEAYADRFRIAYKGVPGDFEPEDYTERADAVEAELRRVAGVYRVATGDVGLTVDFEHDQACDNALKLLGVIYNQHLVSVDERDRFDRRMGAFLGRWAGETA